MPGLFPERIRIELPAASTRERIDMATTSGTTARGINESLNKRLGKDSTLLRDFGTLTEFGIVVATSKQLTVAALLALTLKSAGAALSAGTSVAVRPRGARAMTATK